MASRRLTMPSSGLLASRRTATRPHTVTPARALARPAQEWRRLLTFQHRVAQAVASAPDAPALLDEVVALTGRLLGAAEGVAWLGSGAALEQVAVWTPGSRAQERPAGTMGLEELLAGSAELIVPLIAAGGVHGVLEFFDVTDPTGVDVTDPGGPDRDVFAALDVAASHVGLDLARRSDGARGPLASSLPVPADDTLAVAVLRTALQRSREASRRMAVLAVGLTLPDDQRVAALAAARLDELAAARGLVLRGAGADRLLVLTGLGADAEAHAERLAAEVGEALGALGATATVDIALSGSPQPRRSLHPAVAPLVIPPVPDPGALAAVSLRVILDRGAVRAEYQPIVDLVSGAVVGYEALARGPRGSTVERPDLLFAAARAAGRVGELDWLCRAAALRGAGTLPSGLSLFVNVEPAALGQPGPAHLEAEWAAAAEHTHVVMEITERALTARPADLLSAVAEARRRGWGVALDDIGADTRSLALMPLLRPDVLKLDLRLVQQQPDEEIAAIVAAVNAERERSGALVLAEGIETDAHLATALALGATLGQGWRFGRPGPLPADLAAGAPAGRLVARPFASAGETARTPYEAVAQARDVQRGTKALLLAMTRQLEQQAARLGPSAVVLSAFQSAHRFTQDTRRRYSQLADQAALVAAFGVGMDTAPAPGVRGAAIPPADPLRSEWSVVVLGPHHGGALVATDLGDDGPDADRRFDFTLTYDRQLVVDAAHALLRRVTPRP